MKTGNTILLTEAWDSNVWKQSTPTLPDAPNSSAPETKNSEIPEMLEKESRVPLLKRIRNYERAKVSR